ncbi:MAG TPA: metal ABC transporter permease [Ktedonobacteraceae bacterium]|jgi:zinc/manganese transport system permease protein|nr:metal ABC transporter permease [Ktedonobacteraceae bacterium]
MIAILQHSFAQNALLAGIIISIVTALVGYFVVLRAQAFAGEAFTDIGFAGATGAVLLGVSAFIGMIAFTLLAALGVGSLGKRIQGRDIEIGMVLSFALGLGVLFLSVYTQQGGPNVGAGVSILFGSILSVTRSDLQLACVISIVVLVVLALIFRPLLFASVDPEVAQTRGVPVRGLSIVFLLLLGVTTAESILVVGALLVSALLIAPAATAQRLAHKPLNVLLLSVGFSLFFTIGGLLLAFLGQLPVGFYITFLSSMTYFASLIYSRNRAARRVTVEHTHRCVDREERVPSLL